MHTIPSLVPMRGVSSSTLPLEAVIRRNPPDPLLVILQGVIRSSIGLMVKLQLSYGLGGAIQNVLEHLGDKLAALV
jgi:hypothetical protein